MLSARGKQRLRWRLRNAAPSRRLAILPAMSFDELNEQLERAVLAAAKQADSAVEDDRITDASNWANITHVLAQALATVRSAYTKRPPQARVPPPSPFA